ncbi:MAG: hypothetical protein CMH75_05450 [Nitrospina sp.]|nr:hypothetical protein [Nitrospina sp.]|tara:strand:+ start:522 stop:749 length:228 start_codon:yes stop_codon:yes gene_type:complete
MRQELKIQLDDQLFKELKKICADDEVAMGEYIKKALKEKINQKCLLPNDEENILKNYLNKGQSGSRNYGIKGQGW